MHRPGLSRQSSLPVLIFVVALAGLALTFRAVVEGDGIGYYSYLHAVIVNHGLDFSAEYRAAEQAGVPLFPALQSSRTPIGLLADFFAVGPAVLSLPAYLVAVLLHPSGAPQYGPPFVDAFAISSLFYGLLGLALINRTTRSWLAVVAVVGATPFAYYLLFDPSYSHTFSVFAVALFLSVWLWVRQWESWTGWLLLGLLAGLMALTRWQDGLLAAVALLDIPRARWRVLLLIPGVVVAFAPQLAVDRALFGSWLPQRPAGQALTPFPGHYWEVLFSSFRGLFVWNPVTLVATVGFFFVRDRTVRAACLLAFLLQIAINGMLPDWSGGLAFGARRFLDLAPFWALGIAALGQRFGLRIIGTVVGVLVAWNVLLLAAFPYLLQNGDPGYGGLVSAGLHGVRLLPRLFGHGTVGQALFFRRLLPNPPSIAEGVALLLGQALCLVAVFVVLRWRTRGDTPGG